MNRRCSVRPRFRSGRQAGVVSLHGKRQSPGRAFGGRTSVSPAYPREKPTFDPPPPYPAGQNRAPAHRAAPRAERHRSLPAGRVRRRMRDMATMCLLHGNWHDGSCWEPLTSRLERLGHRALTPDLPLHDPTAGYAERARPAIEALASAEPPVVVVGHSLPAGIAPIVAAGTAATIVIYLCPAPTGPFADVDVEVAAVRRTFSLPPADEHGASVWDAEAAVETMYARLP